jgi:hypothetical protein
MFPSYPVMSFAVVSVFESENIGEILPAADEILVLA